MLKGQKLFHLGQTNSFTGAHKWTSCERTCFQDEHVEDFEFE